MKTLHAGNEVSSDKFVSACITFQLAKAALAENLPGLTLDKLDNVSRGVYEISNKLLRRKVKETRVREVPLKFGEKITFREVIAKVVRGRKTFTIPDVIEGLKKQKALPDTADIGHYISSTLGANGDLFKRVERGIYTVKSRRRLVLKKSAKALPATTS